MPWTEGTAGARALQWLEQGGGGMAKGGPGGPGRELELGDLQKLPCDGVYVLKNLSQNMAQSQNDLEHLLKTLTSA